MIWKQKASQWVVIIAITLLSITFILSFLILLPSIMNGPDNLHILERNQCSIDKVNYLDNWCLRDTNSDFTALQYREDWEKCLVIEYNITTSSNQTCTWKYPQKFNNQKEAFIETSREFFPGQSYDCIIDSIENICYPDKKELLIFIISLSIQAFLLIIAIIIYCYIRKWTSRKKDKISRNL